MPASPGAQPCASSQGAPLAFRPGGCAHRAPRCATCLPRGNTQPSEKALTLEMKTISSSKRMAELIGYYDKPSDLYFETPECARRKDFMREHFDYGGRI